MPAALILNASQAKALANIISELNNIGGTNGSIAIIGGRAQEDIRVTWDEAVEIRRGALGHPREVYETQTGFFTAYGLN